MKSRALACLIVATAACGGSTTNPGDASAPNDSGSPSDAADAGAKDSATAPDSAAEGGVITEQSCAHSVACGTSGKSCDALDGGACGSSSSTCYCQSYGQPRCLDLNGDAGGPGARCTASNGCGPGLTCVQFGPDAFCFYCGD
jgi:hypothetical protein